MQRQWAVLAAILLAGWTLPPPGACDGAGVPGPRKALDFKLIDHLDRSHELYRYSDAKAIVVVVQGNGCMILRKSVPAIKALRDRFAGRGVVFLMLNANPQDSREEVARMAREFGVDLPILMDETQTVAGSLGLTRTAEALLIDPTGWHILYQGSIDDRLGYGTQKPRATKTFLADAIESHLAGKPVDPARTSALGCLITYLKAPEASYSKDIAPVLGEKCSRCHQRDSPVPLTSYEDVRGWASMIRETLMTRRMPPWSADPHYGGIVDKVSLSPEELRRIVHWIDEGAPRGDGPDPLAYAGRRHAPVGWTLGEPDIVLALEEEQVVPATGTLTYRYAPMTPVPSGELWMRAIQLQGNPNVIHHAELFHLPGPALPDPQGPAWAKKAEALIWKDRGAFHVDIMKPGIKPWVLPEGTAMPLARGGYPVLELHYTPSGKRETDRPRVGLYLYKGTSPPKEYHVDRSSLRDFKIPPGAKDFEVSLERSFPRDILVHELWVHMHSRGRRARFEARHPDGRTETLLSVPDYDFRWQYKYRLSRPRLLAAGTRILARGAFDNSAQNPANPDPSRWVKEGRQFTDEMFLVWICYTVP